MKLPVDSDKEILDMLYSGYVTKECMADKHEVSSCRCFSVNSKVRH